MHIARSCSDLLQNLSLTSKPNLQGYIGVSPATALTSNTSEWLMMDTSLVSLDGTTCNKIGTSYTAFQFQSVSTQNWGFLSQSSVLIACKRLEKAKYDSLQFLSAVEDIEAILESHVQKTIPVRTKSIPVVNICKSKQGSTIFELSCEELGWHALHEPLIPLDSWVVHPVCWSLSFSGLTQNVWRNRVLAIRMWEPVFSTSCMIITLLIKHALRLAPLLSTWSHAGEEASPEPSRSDYPLSEIEVEDNIDMSSYCKKLCKNNSYGSSTTHDLDGRGPS